MTAFMITEEVIQYILDYEQLAKERKKELEFYKDSLTQLCFYSEENKVTISNRLNKGKISPESRAALEGMFELFHNIQQAAQYTLEMGQVLGFVGFTEEKVETIEKGITTVSENWRSILEKEK